MENPEYLKWRARQCFRYANAAWEPELVKFLRDLGRDFERRAAAVDGTFVIDRRDDDRPLDS
jgi:hypothetical protein